MAEMKNELAIQNAMARGDDDFARDLLRQAIQEQPELAQVWYLAAQVAINDQQRAHFLEQAIERDPLHHQAANELSRLQNPTVVQAPQMPQTPEAMPMPTTSVTSLDVNNERLDYADFSQRMGAFVVDAFILTFATILGLFIIDRLFGGSDVDTGRVFTVTLLWSVALQAGYGGYFLARTGQTVGKRMMGIRVQKRDGGVVSLRDAILRSVIGYALSGSFLGTGFFWMLTNEQAQGWHDMVADTVVVRTGDGQKSLFS